MFFSCVHDISMPNEDGHLGVKDIATRGEFHKSVTKGSKDSLGMHRDELLRMTRNLIADGVKKAKDLEPCVEAVHASSTLLKAINQSVQIIPEMALAMEAIAQQEDEDTDE